MNDIEPNDLALARDVLGELDSDLRKLGYAGSTDIVRLAFLCLQTRRFEKLVSLVIKGPSGCGKSFALSSALNFVPSQTYEYFSGMSERAIVYSGLDLEHKHLVIAEAAGLSGGVGRAFLRQMISEGRIRYMTVQSTEKGVHGKELPPIKGPCGLIMTTTANALHPEDESRMLTVNMPESGEQIRRALLAQARGRSNQEAVDFNKWHELDAFIGGEPNAVSIPFAEPLAKALPVTHFRVQRDFPQVLSLIGAHALLHKGNRARNTDNEIVASLEDYAAVYALVNGPISQGLESAVPDNIRLLVTAVEELAGKAGAYAFETSAVSQRQLAEHLGRDQSVISRNVWKAIDEGYLANSAQGQGREAKLVLGERQLPQGYALPEPERLREPVEA